MVKKLISVVCICIKVKKKIHQKCILTQKPVLNIV
jgi:hypothetical protein